MPSIEPRPDQFRALVADAELPGSILMLNMLRFREPAAYPDDFDAEPCSGREAYDRYSAAAQPFLEKVGGAPIWAGPAQHRRDRPRGRVLGRLLPRPLPEPQGLPGDGHRPRLPGDRARTAAPPSTDSRLILCDDVAEVPDGFGLPAS